MGILKADYTIVTITMQRWQKDWLKQQQSINFSGLVQEMVAELIKQRDPSYFEVHGMESNTLIRRQEMIKTIITKHPEIIPLNNNT